MHALKLELSISSIDWNLIRDNIERKFFVTETVPGGYVLRLVVVKVEGILVPPVESWDRESLPENQSTRLDLSSQKIFSEWTPDRDEPPQWVREWMAEQAGEFRLDEPLRQFLNWIKNHTPVRVGLLSVGPREWIQALESELNLEPLRDLTFHYDDYPHGDRRTLLQFLMNRFIAGKGRTLLLGNHPEDEGLALSEKARFRSLVDPPSDTTVQNLDSWGADLDEMREFIRQIQPAN